MTAAKYESLQNFLLDTPLYNEVEIDNDQLKTKFIHALENGAKIDGFCPHCKKDTTFDFSFSGNSQMAMERIKNAGSYGVCRFALDCARTKMHQVVFYSRLIGWKIQKVGQYPSFADITIDQSKKFSSVLNKQDARELHRAIGLGAHGVGIGSFVYLRRIFERLVQGRFDEFKNQENWDETDWQKLRMNGKIELLKNHLPDSMVKNRAIYSHISLGLHELTEEECLKDFEVLYKTIEMILDDDLRKKHELESRHELEKAIANRQQELKARENNKV